MSATDVVCRTSKPSTTSVVSVAVFTAFSSACCRAVRDQYLHLGCAYTAQDMIAPSSTNALHAVLCTRCLESAHFHNLGCEHSAWPGASKDHSAWVHMKYLIPAQPLLSNNQMLLAPYARLPFKSSASHNTPGIQEFLKRALGALLFKWR